MHFWRRGAKTDGRETALCDPTDSTTPSSSRHTCATPPSPPSLPLAKRAFASPPSTSSAFTDEPDPANSALTALLNQRDNLSLELLRLRSDINKLALERLKLRKKLICASSTKSSDVGTTANRGGCFLLA